MGKPGTSNQANLSLFHLLKGVDGITRKSEINVQWNTDLKDFFERKSKKRVFKITDKVATGYETYINAKVLREKIDKHKLKYSHLINLPLRIEQPMMVLKSLEFNNSLMSFIQGQNEEGFLQVILKDKGGKLELFDIVNIGGRNLKQIDWYLQNSELINFDQNKIRRWLMGSGFHCLKSKQSANYATNIKKFFENKLDGTESGYMQTDLFGKSEKKCGNQPIAGVSNVKVINQYDWQSLPDSFKVPQVPKSFEINNETDLFKALKSFIGTDTTRPVFTGIFFDKNSFIATDAHRLVILKGGFKTNKKGLYKPFNVKIDAKFPNYTAVIPECDPQVQSVFKIDLLKIKTFSRAMLEGEFTIYQLKFKYGEGKYIGFAAKLLIDMCNFWLTRGKQECYIHIKSPANAVVFSGSKKYNTYGSETITLLMPLMLRDDEKTDGSKFTGAAEHIDLGNEFVNEYDLSKDGLIDTAGNTIQPMLVDAKSTKINYGGIDKTAFDYIGKILKKNTALPILECVCVQKGVLRITNLEAEWQLKKVNLPDGIYRYTKLGLIPDKRFSAEEYPASRNTPVNEITGAPFAPKNTAGNKVADAVAISLSLKLKLLSLNGISGFNEAENPDHGEEWKKGQMPADAIDALKDRDYLETFKQVKPDKGLNDAHRYFSKETNDFTNWENLYSNSAIAESWRKHKKIVAYRLNESKSRSAKSAYSPYYWEGSKYKHIEKKGLGTKEIAELIRIELKIEFPDYKISVRSEFFSGGSAINIYISDIDFNPFTEAYTESLNKGVLYDEFQRNDQVYNQKVEIFNEKYKSLFKRAEAIATQYQFNDNDSQSDYFHTNYYDHVSIETDDWKKKINPNHPEVLRHERFEVESAARKKKQDEIASQRKGKFKKGEVVIYNNDNLHNSWHKYAFAQGKYYAVIIKSPNGRARFSSYNIQILKEISEKEFIALEEKYKGYRKSWANMSLVKLNGKFYTRVYNTINPREESLQALSKSAEPAVYEIEAQALILKLKLLNI